MPFNGLRFFSTLFLSFCTGFLFAAEPLTYTATYQSSYEFLSASTELVLLKLGNGRYRLETNMGVSVAGANLLNVSESSEFSWEQDTLIPRSYLYTQTGVRRKAQSVQFDWENLSAVSTDEGRSLELTVAPGMFDKLSYQLALRQQLLETPDAELVFHIVDGDKIDEQRFQIIGEELLLTGLGQLNTLRIDEVRDPSSRRNTSIWLAKDWGLLLVRLIQTDSSGSETELLLQQAVIGERKVTPLQ